MSNIPNNTIESTVAYTALLIIPEYIDEAGTYTFEKVAKLADSIAAVPCLKYMPQHSVATASIERFVLKKPVILGDYIELKARIIATTSKTMLVEVLIYQENVKERSAKKQIGEAYFIYVALEDGKAVPIPPLSLSTEEDQKINSKGLAILAENKARRLRTS